MGRRAFGTLGLGGRGWPRFFAGATLLGAGMMAGAVGGLWALGSATLEAAPRFAVAALALTALAVLLKSVTQEVLVQGYVLQTVEAHGTRWLAVPCAAGIFVLLHAAAIDGAWLLAVNLYLAGILLAWAYVLSRSLWLPIGVHFGWNFTQGPLLGLRVTGRDLGSDWRPVRLEGAEILTGGPLGIEGGLMATLATLAGIAALLAWRRARRG